LPESIAEYPLSQKTRIKTGGIARHWVDVSSADHLKRVCQWAKNAGKKIYTLGSGSNVVIDDNTIDAVVIRLGGELKRLEFDETHNCVSVGAGTSLMRLGHAIIDKGFSGCQYMAVIPGTVGGAVRMNAGTSKEGEIKDQLSRVQVFDCQDSRLKAYTADELQFGYRTSKLANSPELIVLNATFHLNPEKLVGRGKAKQQAKELAALRKKKQPKNHRNFGSTFKQPIGKKPAGWYLDQVCMKGLVQGDAMVAHEHANWIVNRGKASSADVKKLIEIGKRRVMEAFGIELEREVIYFPQDMDLANGDR
jgi:UDP-N-acetylmuramate dehydrogenase